MAMISRAEHERRIALYEQGLKRCSTCPETLPIERFRSNARGWMGLRSRCEDCDNSATLERQKRDPEKVSARVRRWNGANRARAHEIAKQYRDTHPLEERLRAGRLRAQKLGVRAEHITADELLTDWQRRGIDPERCVYTGDRLLDGWHIDHAVPLATPGTPGHVVSNLVPTNRTINSSKRNRHFVDYLADRAEAARKELAA